MQWHIQTGLDVYSPQQHRGGLKLNESPNVDSEATTREPACLSIFGRCLWRRSFHHRFVIHQIKCQKTFGDNTWLSRLGPQVCSNRVAEGDYSPPAPTDPYVRALPHTVPQITVSLRVEASSVLCAQEQVDTAEAMYRISARSANGYGCGGQATYAIAAQLADEI